MGGLSQVDLGGLCKAFEVMGEDGSGQSYAHRICDTLDLTQGSYSPYLYRDSYGDGMVRVPTYEAIGGRRQISEHRYLTESGAIMGGPARDRWEAGRVDSTIARYFIAAAFGIEELTDRVGIDLGLVKYLRSLTGICANNPSGCLQGSTASRTKQKWGAVKQEQARVAGERTRLEARRREVQQIAQGYRYIEVRVQAKDDLLVKTAHWRDQLVTDPKTFAECDRAIALYTEMIAVAQAMLDRENTSGRDQWMRDQIAMYRTKIPQQRKTFIEAERKRRVTSGFILVHNYDKFSDPMEKADACFEKVTPQGLKQQYCALKNQSMMIAGLHRKMDNYPEKDVCLRHGAPREKSCTSSDRNQWGCTCKTVSANPYSIGSGWSHTVCEGTYTYTPCLESGTKGKDYTDDELISGAQWMCSQATSCSVEYIGH